MDRTEGTAVRRRDVLGGLAAGTALAAALDANAAADTRKRYVSVGVGSRNRMFQDALWGPHKAHGALIAACDTNPGRLDHVAQRAIQAGAKPPKPFLAADFDKMLRELKPDAVMLADIFDPNAPKDPLLRAADERSGAASILVGVAANRCFETGNPVKIAELVTGLDWPDYPKMPGHKDPVTQPPRIVRA